MGFMEILTLIFVILKLIGVVSWSWWIVLLPIIISFSGYLIWFIISITVFGVAVKGIKKHF